MYSATTTFSYIVSTVWLFSVALEATVNCGEHDYDHHGVYPPRDDYRLHQQSERLHDESDRYDRRPLAYDSRPSEYDHQRPPVYQDPLYYAPKHNTNNKYHHSEPSYYHDGHSKHKSSSPQHYPDYRAANPNVGLLKATASNMLKEELNRSLNRGLQHAIHDVKHQLSPETRNTIRNLKNELIYNNPGAKAKRFSKKVDSIVKQGGLLAKALK